MPSKNNETNRRYRELFKRPKAMSAAERRKLIEDARAAEDAAELIQRCRAKGLIR
jgi:hypothetical protein